MIKKTLADFNYDYQAYTNNELFNYKIQHQMEIEFLKLMYEYRQNERNGKCKEYKPSPKREY